MTIRQIFILGIAAVSMGAIGAALPAQAARTEASCLLGLPPHSLTDTTTSDEESDTDAINACADLNAPAPAPVRHAKIVTVKPGQTVTVVGGTSISSTAT